MVRIIMMFLALCTVGCTPQHRVVIQKNTVNITLHLHEVDEVAFASSLDQFQMHQAHQGKHGQWYVSGLPNQEFEYFFLVDGNVMVPECRYTVQDDFGAMNCRYLP